MTDLMRVSVSSLDSWRYFMASDTMTEQNFIDELTGKRPVTIAMTRGSAWHRFMEAMHARYYESPDSGELDNVIIEGDTVIVPYGSDVFEFTVPDAVGSIVMPPGHAEHNGRYEVDGADFVITGRCDLVTETEVWDYKTQSKGLDIESYYDSMQWRAYLMLFEKEHFVYNWFRLRPRTRGAKYEYLVTEQTRFDQWRYEGIEGDVLEVAHELADFRRSRGLWNLYRR